MSPSSRVTLMSDVSLTEATKDIPSIMSMKGVELGTIGSIHSSSAVDNLGTVGVVPVVLHVLWHSVKDLEYSCPSFGMVYDG